MPILHGWALVFQQGVGGAGRHDTRVALVVCRQSAVLGVLLMILVDLLPMPHNVDIDPVVAPLHTKQQNVNFAAKILSREAASRKGIIKDQRRQCTSVG